MAGHGKKTSFDGMTHEQMLAWLDAADAGTVQAAADKLAAAAKEIHSIADELKVRPQWVKWKGEGADSFRQWAGKLANATVALGDYSQESSKWLGHAAQAISKAKTSVPRDKGVDANIDAARSAHNDPDSQSILSKNMAVRQQTADELDKLGQAYSLTTSQMAAARKTEALKFPPPPADIQDPDRAKLDSGGYRRRPEDGTSSSAALQRASMSDHSSFSRSSNGSTDAGAGTSATAAGAEPGHAATGSASVVEPAHARVTPPTAGQVSVDPDASMDIDSTAVLPDRTPQAPSPTSTGPAPGTSGQGPTYSTVPGSVPPVVPGNGNVRQTNPVTGTARGIPSTGGGGPATRTPGPMAQGVTGRPANPGPRGPMTPGQNAVAGGRTGGPGTSGSPPATNGVAGGRPQPSPGRSTTGIPRGTVMGGENGTGGRGTTPGQGAVTGRPSAPAGRTGGGAAGRRVTGSTAGDSGIVGGRAQQGRPNARSFSVGGSGLVRGQGSAAGPQGARPRTRREEGDRSERPDYVTEDERTWQADERRNVPPVVDAERNDAEKNDAQPNSER
ncbi:hypothetical protein [Streptomyces sp. NPDC016845]|uniref:hypothetical protein n=1 Tax=Streptomyces sp. NPDC016845 TaxID=3364972 RepID=UPI00378FF28B